MENLHQLLLERHSIRRYTDNPVPADDVTKILQAALLSPSSKSKRPWRFVVVEDRDTLLKLSGCKRAGAVSLKGAAFAVAVMADPTDSDMWLEDCTVAALMMQLQAADLGVGSCWVQVRDRYTADGTPSVEIVREILNIPDNYIVECIVTFGYSAETRRPVDPDKLQWEKVYIGNWSEREGDGE